MSQGHMEYESNYGSKHERHLVVYIESQNCVPHAVITVQWDAEKGVWREYCNYWDFNLDQGGPQLLFYNSGGGGGCKDIEAPHYTESAINCTVWLHPMASFEEGSVPINCTLVAEPPIYVSDWSTSANPFDHGEEHGNIDYCAACNLYYGEYGCDDHNEYCEDCCAYYGDEGCPEHGLHNEEEE